MIILNTSFCIAFTLLYESAIWINNASNALQSSASHYCSNHNLLYVWLKEKEIVDYIKSDGIKLGWRSCDMNCDCNVHVYYDMYISASCLMKTHGFFLILRLKTVGRKILDKQSRNLLLVINEHKQ